MFSCRKPLEHDPNKRYCVQPSIIVLHEFHHIDAEKVKEERILASIFLSFYILLFIVLKEEPDDTANLTLSSTSSSPSNASPVNNMCSSIALNRSNALSESCLPPLDDSTPLFGEIFDELILPDGYGTLLSDDVNSIDSQTSKVNIDPFMNYRDESCDTVGTPNLLSPDALSKVNGRKISAISSIFSVCLCVCFY